VTDREREHDLRGAASKLFAAAREEQPDERIRARTKQLARNAMAGVSAARSREHARSSASPSWPVLGQALALACVVALVLIATARPSSEPPKMTIKPDVLEPQPQKPATSEPREPVQTTSESVEGRLAPPAPPAAPVTAKRQSRPAPTLAEEIALLDEARSALSAKDYARVIALVQRYEQELSGTRMRAEAQLLRIEALAQSGQRQRAADLAKTFVRQHAGDPLADRARTLANIDDQHRRPEGNEP
jgi:hypothetical protein